MHSGKLCEYSIDFSLKQHRERGSFVRFGQGQSVSGEWADDYQSQLLIHFNCGCDGDQI